MIERLKAIKDTVLNGLLIGLIVPLIPGSLVWYAMQHFAVLRKADLLLIGCIAVNALTMNFFFKFDKENVGKGIISATFLWAFVFFFYKVI